MEIFPKLRHQSAPLQRGLARRVRAKVGCILLFLNFLPFRCASADNSIRIEFGGVTRNEVKNEIVLFTTRDDKSRLSQETNFQLSFDKDADNTKNNPVYQASKPIIRTTYTIADTPNGVQVVVNDFLIENAGTALERRTALSSDDEVHSIQSILELVKKGLQGPAMRSTAESLPRLYKHFDNLNRPSVEPKTAPKALFGKDANEIPLRLGFSAELSKDSSHAGVVVVSVEPHTPADTAGLQANDIVTSFDGKPIKTREDMEAAKAKIKGKKRGKIQVIRDGKQYDATLKLQ